MRRALAAATIVLVVAWLSPALACTCSTSGDAAHAHGEPAPSRDPGCHAAPEEAGERPSQPVCCEPAGTAPAVVAALPDAPKPSPTPVLRAEHARPVAVPVLGRAATGAFWREPPRLPFASTYRPLLI